MPSILTSEPATAAPPASPVPSVLRNRRLQRQTLGALRWLFLGLLTALSMTTVLWLVLQWVILPRMEAWRPALERHVSATLGRPVRIGAIEVLDTGLGWSGTVELQQVVLLEPRSGREALRLPRVQAMFSPTSLLPGWDGVWRLRFRQLLIDAPELQVQRDAAGRFSSAGLEVGAASDGGEALADWWLLAAADFRIGDMASGFVRTAVFASQSGGFNWVHVGGDMCHGIAPECCTAQETTHHDKTRLYLNSGV